MLGRKKTFLTVNKVCDNGEGGICHGPEVVFRGWIIVFQYLSMEE